MQRVFVRQTTFKVCLARADAGEEADVVGELGDNSFRRGRTWHAPDGRHGAGVHNPFAAAAPPPESRMTHPPDSITAQWRATRQALVRACALSGQALVVGESHGKSEDASPLGC